MSARDDYPDLANHIEQPAWRVSINGHWPEIGIPPSIAEQGKNALDEIDHLRRVIAGGPDAEA